VQRFLPLLEFLAHLENSSDQQLSLFDVPLGYWVVFIGSRKMVILVLGLVLKHFCEELGWGNIRIELFLFTFDSGALIFENHCSTSLAVLQFDVVSD